MLSPAGSSLYWSEGAKTESRLTDRKLIGSLLLKHAEGHSSAHRGGCDHAKGSVCLLSTAWLSTSETTSRILDQSSEFRA